MPALSAVLLIFSFPFSLLFVQYIARKAASALQRLVVTRNIGHRTLPKIWVGTFLVRSVYSPGKRFELIITVKCKIDIL